MLLEMDPIRVTIDLHPQADRSHQPPCWLRWWQHEAKGNCVSEDWYKITLPERYHVSTVAEGTTIISPGKDATEKADNYQVSPELRAETPYLTIDTKTRTVNCYAHPLGGGTFYYVNYDGYLLLSTSLHDLCCVTQVWEPDEETVVDHCFSTCVFATDPSRTFISGIRQIPPGAMLSYKHDAVSVRAYWHPQRASTVQTLDMEEAVDQVRTALRHATERAIGSARCVGVLYSGGLDSSTVAAYALEYLRPRGGELILFSAGEEVCTVEECMLRRAFANAVNCRLVELPIDLTQNIIPTLRQANRCASYPRNSLFANVVETLGREAAAHGVEVMLTGDGGEEVFGFQNIILADFILRGQWGTAYKALSYITAVESQRWERLLGDGLWPVSLVARGGMQKRLLHAASRLIRKQPASTQESVKTNIPLYGGFATRIVEYVSRRDCNLQNRFEEGWSFADYAILEGAREIQTFMTQLDYQDSFRMRVEAPLSDPEIFEAALTLKLEERVHIGIGSRSKLLLRFATGNAVPSSVRNHGKIGVSDLLWRTVGHASESILEVLHAPSLQRLGISPNVRIYDLMQLPSYGHLGIIQLALLGIWLEELKDVVETTKF